MKVKTELRDQILGVLENHLDTRDKRYMFLKLTFPKMCARIQLEGSAEETAFNIFDEVERQEMIEALIARLNSAFQTNIPLFDLYKDKQ